jgi:kynurenine formamidase
MQVDLSHPIGTGMQTYPGDPAVEVYAHATHESDGFHVDAVRCGSHTGTHIDAPSHTEPDGRTLDSYPVERFVFDAVVADCRDLGAREPIPASRVPRVDADLVAFRTGWDTHWGTDAYLEHPYLSPAAAEACADRGLGVAVDTLSPDPTPTNNASDDEPTDFRIHHTLLGNDLLILENLTALDRVADRFELRAYPMALASDGAPVRAVGVFPE